MQRFDSLELLHNGCSDIERSCERGLCSFAFKLLSEGECERYNEVSKRSKCLNFDGGVWRVTEAILGKSFLGIGYGALSTRNMTDEMIQE